MVADLKVSLCNKYAPEAVDKKLGTNDTEHPHNVMPSNQRSFYFRKIFLSELEEGSILVIRINFFVLSNVFVKEPP